MNMTQVSRAISAWIAETGNRDAIVSTSLLTAYLERQGFQKTEILPELTRLGEDYFESLNDDSFRLSQTGIEALRDAMFPAAMTHYEARIHQQDGTVTSTKFFLSLPGLKNWLDRHKPKPDTYLTFHRGGAELSANDLK
jgi:hypothetical protein